MCFLFPLFGENTRPSLTRRDDSSSLLCVPLSPALPSSPCIAAQTAERSTHRQFGLCQSGVRFGQQACDIMAVFVDWWWLADAVVTCFSSVGPFRLLFRVWVLISVSRSDSKHSELADDYCGIRDRGNSWGRARVSQGCCARLWTPVWH